MRYHQGFRPIWGGLGKGGGLNITCDITYMIYHQTLILDSAYDIIVFAYDIIYTI